MHSDLDLGAEPPVHTPFPLYKRRLVILVLLSGQPGGSDGVFQAHHYGRLGLENSLCVGWAIPGNISTLGVLPDRHREQSPAELRQPQNVSERNSPRVQTTDFANVEHVA